MLSLGPSEKDAGASPRSAPADLDVGYFLRYSSWQPLHAEPMPPTAFRKAPCPSLAAAAKARARSVAVVALLSKSAISSQILSNPSDATPLLQYRRQRHLESWVTVGRFCWR